MLLREALARQPDRALLMMNEEAAPVAAAPPAAAALRPFPYFTLLWEMTRCDFKLRDQGTLLGFFWTLLNPALQFIVMYALFTKWMGSMVNNYALYLIVGLVQWGFFANSTTNALQCLRAKGFVIQSFKFPREIIVLAAVGSILWSHLLELFVLLVGLLLFTHTVSWTWLYLPLLVVIEVAWSTGVSFFLSRLFIQYRDLDRIWMIFMQIGFFATPIFYPLEIIAKNKRFWLMLNPLVHIMDGMRGCLLRDSTPPVWIVLSLIGGSAALNAAALLWFRRMEGTIVDHI